MHEIEKIEKEVLKLKRSGDHLTGCCKVQYISSPGELAAVLQLLVCDVNS